MRVLKARSRTEQCWPLRSMFPERFAMTAGVLVPLDRETDGPLRLPTRRNCSARVVEEAVDDRRFAEAIYRVALAVAGLMEQVAYRDTIAKSG